MAITTRQKLRCLVVSDRDRRIEPPPATVIHHVELVQKTSPSLLKRAVRFKSAGKELGIANSEWILSRGYKEYEDLAIALLPSAVPDNLIVGSHLLELCNLRFTQLHGRNLVCFNRRFDLSLTHASATKQAPKERYNETKHFAHA